MSESWLVTGSYFEACSCLPICPCREVGGREGGRSTYGICDFALSWIISTGHYGSIDLAGRRVVMIGSYDDDRPGANWTVGLFIDEEATEGQQKVLEDIFLGRVGGTPSRNYAGAIESVSTVRAARIELDHRRNHWTIRVDGTVDVVALEEVPSSESVACGIPGVDHPGAEVRTSTLHVHDGPLVFEWNDRCGFATDFDYRSDLAVHT